MNPMRMRPRTPVAAAGVDRRVFLKATAAAGAGLTLGIWSGTAAAQASGPGKTVGGAAAGGFEPNAFLTIGIDNTVTVYVKHLEMGQGTYTGLPTLVAEELDCAWSQIRATGAPADASRYANLFWGTAQGTGGSTAIANSFEQYRQAGAAARAMLVAAAAKQWNVPPESVQVKSGVVFHANGKKATFGELASAAAREPVPANVKLKDAKDFVFIGKHVPRTDSKAKSNGTAQFTQDVKLPEMLTARRRASAAFRWAVQDLRSVRRVEGAGRTVRDRGSQRDRRRRDDVLAGEERPRRAQDRMGRYRRLQTLVLRHHDRVPPAGGNAGQGRAQRRRRGEGRRQRGEEVHGLLRIPVPRARGDGAARLRDPARRRELRGLERRAVPDRRPARDRAGHGLEARAGQAQHALRGRQLRAPRESCRRLPGGGRRHRQGDRDQDEVDGVRSSSCGRARTT